MLTISDSFSGVAKDINSALGTSIDGFELFAATVVLTSGTVQRAFVFMTDAIAGFAAALGVGLAPVYFIIGLVTAAVYACRSRRGKPIGDIVGDVGKTSHGDEIFTGLVERLTALGELIKGVAKALFDLATYHPKDAFDEATKSLSDFMQAWKDANEKQAAGEKAKDDVDKQVAEGQKRRQQELLDAEKNTNQSAVADHSSAANDKVATSKAATDKMIADAKRLSDAMKGVTTPSLPRSGVTRNSDGSVTDANGIRIFRGTGDGGQPQVQQESLLHAQMAEMLRQTKDLDLTELLLRRVLWTRGLSDGGIPRLLTTGVIRYPTNFEPIENPPLPTPDPLQVHAEDVTDAIKEGTA